MADGVADPVPTGQKALLVNMDRSRYGTIAEIGAGQEVARWFFRVGGAAGTIAKSISAYDMTVSDSLYGQSPRYVSQERLRQMLDREYAALVAALAPTRGADTAFFAFADTVATRSYTRKEDGVGWVGCRFQDRPGAEPSQVLLHARLLDAEATLQQEVLGLLGVNLIHATSFLHVDVGVFMGSLGDHLSRERVEVDLLDVAGPVFAGADVRQLCLELLERRLARALTFAPDGRPVEPSALLHKRALCVLPGAFRPVLGAELDVLAAAEAQVRGDGVAERPLSLAAITVSEDREPGERVDLLARVDALSAVGVPALVTDIDEWWRVAAYFERYTRVRVVFAAGADAFADVFREKRFEELDGGVFEALGRLFNRWVRVAIYPPGDRRAGEPFALSSLPVDPEYRHLLQHLLHTGLVRELQVPGVPPSAALAERVLSDLRGGGSAWEAAVPAAAVSLIKSRGLFGRPR